MLSKLQLLNGEMFQARPVVRLQVDIHKQLQHVTSSNICAYLLITMGTQNLHLLGVITYIPFFGGLKPSCFMVLGFKGAVSTTA